MVGSDASRAAMLASRASALACCSAVNARGRRDMNHEASTGTTVIATSNDASSATVTVTANGLNSSPA